MVQLTDISLKQLTQGLRNKEFSATDLVKSYIESIKSKKCLNVYITESFDVALKSAELSDAAFLKGTARKLEGIPVGIKDSFCTEGIRTTAASKMLENFIPTYESGVTRKLKTSGAIFLGKTNMDEFAMGSSSTSSYFNPVVNPWGGDEIKDLVAGGSSGGSSVAVSAKMAVAAIGTDTGGSVRQPASFSGVVGVKPSYGRASRWGMIPFASSLDQAGVFARNVEDVSMVLPCIMGFDPYDSTSRNLEVDNLEKELNQSIKGLRIGVPFELSNYGLDKDVELVWNKSIKILQEEGAIIEEIKIPYLQEALSVYYVISCSEASSNLARYDGVRYGHRSKEGETFDEMISATRAEGFGEEVQRRILVGTYLLSSGFIDQYYMHTKKIRHLISEGFLKIFQNTDAILLPTCPTPAFSASDISNNPVDMYKNDIFTVFANLIGSPAISVPAGLSSGGLPLGMQLMTKLYDEKTLIRVAHALERNININFVPKNI